MNASFDLVVIGTGSAAMTVAYKCRKADWRVAIVDSLPFGGTCALRGCDPKKVLVGAAEVIDFCRRMKGRGVLSGDTRIDWAGLMRFKRTFTDPVPAQREKSLAEAGISTFHGHARFTAPGTIAVGQDNLSAKHFVVATGARPIPLGVPGEELLTTSDQFLDLERLPSSLVFVGGGYIAMEFAHLAARAGSEVTILHRGPRPLPRFDPELVDLLVERTRRLGVTIRLGTAVTAIEESGGSLKVHASASGETVTVSAEMVVHSGGRVPNVAALGLEAAGIEYTRQGVTVNEYLQSVSNPAVYSAGDSAHSGGAPLTPVAGYEGRIVAANLLDGNHSKPDYNGLASVAFTVPPVAAVGLSEYAAQSQGLRFRVLHEDTSGWYSSRRIAEECSGFKLLVEEETGRILGAHILGDRAEEVINLFALAIRYDLTARHLSETLFSYPTHSSDVQYMV